MSWQSEIDELEHRKHLGKQMGGPEGIRANTPAAS